MSQGDKAPKRFGETPLGLLLAVIIAVAAAIAIAAVIVPGVKPADDDEPELAPEEVLDAARAFYETRPYYETPHPYTEVPVGLPDLRSETCGACHGEIYREWQLSTHRRAWTDDAQFMEELAKSRGDHAGEGEEKVDVSWMCVNCHTPLVNQLEKLVVGLENGDIGKPIYAANPHFDAVLQEDAIGCATCHVRDGIVYGPFGDTDAPHPVARGEYLLTEENCIRCHQAEAHFPDQNLACFFTTGDEFAASPHAAEGQTCQSCHMPSVTRKLAEAYDLPERETRRHWFGGSLIPKHPDFAGELEELLAVYGSGADIEVLALSKSDAEPDHFRLAVRIKNSNTAHLFPTGDPERHIDVEARATASSGAELAQSTLRIGSIYEWWPAIRLVSDNRLKPGEHHDLILEVPHAALAGEQGFTVEIKAEKMRMHKDAFEYHELEGRYVRGRTFHESVWRVGPDGQPTLETIKDDHGSRQTLRP